MGASMEILNGLGSGMGVGQEAVTAFTGGAFALVSVFKAMHGVSGGEVGIRTFGKRPKIKNGHYVTVQPGLRWSIPFTHSIETIDVRWQPTPIKELFIDRTDADDQYRVEASFIWRISPQGDNPGKGRYEVDGIENIVPETCFSGLRTVMTNIGIEQIANEPAIEAQVKDLCDERLATFGAEMNKLNLISVARSIGSMLRGPAQLSTNGNGHAASALAVASGALPGTIGD